MKLKQDTAHALIGWKPFKTTELSASTRSYFRRLFHKRNIRKLQAFLVFLPPPPEKKPFGGSKHRSECTTFLGLPNVGAWPFAEPFWDSVMIRKTRKTRTTFHGHLASVSLSVKRSRFKLANVIKDFAWVPAWWWMFMPVVQRIGGHWIVWKWLECLGLKQRRKCSVMI